MNNANEGCFLVKKKRYRKSGDHKKKPNNENERLGKEEINKSKQEKNMCINEKENPEKRVYKLIECGDNRIVLLKEKTKNNTKTSRTKAIQEAHKDVLNSLQNENYTDSDFLLDYDKFLEEYFRSEPSPTIKKGLETVDIEFKEILISSKCKASKGNLVCIIK